MVAAARSQADDIPTTSWLTPLAAVGRSPIDGLGLFATSDLPAGTVVAELGGAEIDDGSVRARLSAGERYDGIALGPNRNLVIEPPNWPGRHGNHSCEPNLAMAGALTIVTRRDVAAGEELTIDYAMHTTDPGWSMACRCGATVCRGTVRGDDWRRPELRSAYRGTWPPVIEALIAADEARS